MKKYSGFTLVELMVGIAIGLLTLLVVVQIMSSSGAQRRITSDGIDSTINAQLGMFDLQRRVRSAGYGLTSSASAVGCGLKLSGYSSTVPMTQLVPVLITKGASSAVPDKITILSSAAKASSWATPLSLIAAHPNADVQFNVESEIGIMPVSAPGRADGDLMVAIPASPAAGSSWCTLFEVSGIAPNLIKHDSASSVMPASGYETGDYLINMGIPVDLASTSVTFSISNNSLSVTPLFYSSNAATPPNVAELYGNIVQLQAQYGLDDGGGGGTAGDKIVDTYTSTTPTTKKGWQQLLSIQVGLLAKSQNKDTKEVTSTPPKWSGGVFDVSTTVGSDWKHYRYKVYENTIPLRNMIWHQ